jgi:sigma-B regulation protein RsbU (phosphoserine phosphatase)
MLIDDDDRSLTYVNAGHVTPFLVSKEKTIPLTAGGFLTGFVSEARYEMDTIRLEKGDILVTFTDGVTEVENPEGEEFGEGKIVDFIRANDTLPAQEIAGKLFQTIREFSQNKKFRDDFTLIILKVL